MRVITPLRWLAGIPWQTKFATLVTLTSPLLLLGLVNVADGFGGRSGPKIAQTTPAHGPVEVQFVDMCTMKLVLLDERIELDTPYGKLNIPLTAIDKIDFQTRIPGDVAKRIETAIADLGHASFKRREIATRDLEELAERAYPALVQAAKSADSEVAHRVEQLLEKIRARVLEDQLTVRPYDVIYTADSKITGRIAAESLKVRTFQFGEQSLRLADIRTLRKPGTGMAVAQGGGLPDPGTLGQLAQQVGQNFVFRVTGNPAGGGVWGTDVYTLDSNLSAAAVHAGVLRPGQAGLVRVTILGMHPGFQASLQNGVNSQGYGPWAGFRIQK
jgi:hypothetical protein